VDIGKLYIEVKPMEEKREGFSGGGAVGLVNG
jgi:hypothetical protein